MSTNQSTIEAVGLPDPKANIDPEKLLTDEEAAAILNVSPRTVQRLRLSKKIKVRRITSKIKRIKGADLKAYIDSVAA